MQKIMFSDRFCLTQAVLEGRKTMTRRLVPEKLVKYIKAHLPGIAVMESRYKVGEVVAVAQAYKDVELNTSGVKRVYNQSLDIYEDPLAFTPGWTNKMFVKAELMPHHIRITNVRVERLQDISGEDCLREGIKEESRFPHKKSYPFYFDGGKRSWDNHFSTPRLAFAALIDKVSGRGTFGSNPWVFVYEFELVK